MRNKVISWVVIAIVLLFIASLLFWYFSPTDVSIVSIRAPAELQTGEPGFLTVYLQNNASNDVNVTINVKNSFVDSKGESLEVVWIMSYENLSYIPSNESNATDKPQKEVMLKPGRNSITFNIGYEVPGNQKVEVEVYRLGKLIDYRAIEVNVPSPKVEVYLQSHKGINGTNEIYAIYGTLRLIGKGEASGVVVDTSVINELTNTTVSTVTRSYSLWNNIYDSYTPLVVWEKHNSTYDPVTDMRTNIDTQTSAPIAVIELSEGEPSAEKYILSSLVVKGKIGDRYKVVTTARWWDQVVTSEVLIPS